MSRPTASALEQDAVASFLESESVGTLSLAKDGESYAVPVSYTFAPESQDVYFRLGYAPDSTKREFVEATERATFVVAAETDAGWTSVLARGELEHRSTVEDLDTRPPGDGSVSQSERELEIPFYHVFDAPDEMLFTLVRLRTDELTGVVEADGG